MRKPASFSVVVFVLLPAFCSLAAAFDGGGGTVGDPYRISTAAQLMSIGSNRDLLNKHYVLTGDIDIGAHSFTTAVIAPDTDATSPWFQGSAFTGLFDGAGHEIVDLAIDTLADGDPNNDGNDFLGLFGKIGNMGQVRNLGVENAAIAGGDESTSLGSLCGLNEGGFIDTCYATGSVSGGSSLGGLCGQNWFGVIDNCYAIGNVTGVWHLGGLSGRNHGGDIINCSATGNVTGAELSYYLGGLCGHNSHSGDITGCHASGAVAGGDQSEYLGGLCGLNEGASINTCSAIGTVSGGRLSSSLGGLCGDNTGDIAGCYATGSVSGGDVASFLGGLCGQNSNIIVDCYATGSVLGGGSCHSLGGLCGFNWQGSIDNCYGIGQVSGGDSSHGLGGLCGRNLGGTVTDSFWDTDTSMITDSDGGTGLETELMKTRSTFLDAGWDFTNESANGTDDIWDSVKMELTIRVWHGSLALTTPAPMASLSKSSSTWQVGGWNPTLIPIPLPTEREMAKWILKSLHSWQSGG